MSDEFLRVLSDSKVTAQGMWVRMPKEVLDRIDSVVAKMDETGTAIGSLASVSRAVQQVYGQKFSESGIKTYLTHKHDRNYWGPKK